MKINSEAKKKYMFLAKIIAISYVIALVIVVSLILDIPSRIYNYILSTPMLAFFLMVSLMAFVIFMLFMCYYNDPDIRKS